MASSADFERILISSHLCVAVLGDRGGEGARGTCRRALAKSPIITSKLDSAGGGLSDAGALQRMKQCTEIGAEGLLPLPSLYHPLLSFYCTSLPPCQLPCPIPSLSLPIPPPLLFPPYVLSASLTPGCLDGKPYVGSLPLYPFPPGWISPSSLAYKRPGEGRP